jgi:uncharacterized protein with GYD domain
MPKYMWRMDLTSQGAQGLLEVGGSARREAAKKMIRGLGGTIEAFYYALGETDLIAIAELPDTLSAAGVGLHVAAGGAARIETIRLLTPEEIDRTVRIPVDYRPAGT